MLRSAATALFLCLPAALLAQVNGSITGTVTDPSGAVIQGVVVTATSEATGLRRETTTSGAGNYEIPALLVGKYQLKFTNSGFKPLVMGGIELTVGQARTVDAQLQLGSLNDVVVETAAEHRYQDRAELRLQRLVAQRSLGDRHPAQHRLGFGLSIGDVERDPGQQPPAADIASAGVEGEHGDPAGE